MSEPTNTRKTLRRAVAQELGMPFFRRFSAGESTTDTGSTASLIKDSALTQALNFWNGSWHYQLGTAEQSIIRSYSFTAHEYSLETPLAAAPADTGDTYEIHTIWNATEIHAAINDAIREVERIFPETIVDKTLVYEEDQLEYSLTGLTRAPWILNQIYIENPSSVVRGTASAGGAATITVESVPSDISTNWKISIYSGTGAGQIRDYVSNAGNVITVAAWTTQPTSTSKYAMWDASKEQYDWINIRDIYQDAKEWPDAIRFRHEISNYFGMRIRLEYLAVPQALTADTDTTTVPRAYILPKAVSILHGQRVGNTKADRELHFGEHSRYKEMADMYVARNAPHTPDTLIGTYDTAVMYGPADDPLGWRHG